MEPGAPRSRRQLPLFRLLPNLLTFGAIVAGLTAIRFAVEGRFEVSVALIVLAAALDGIDGRLARMLGSESEIGAELDSLADFLNFGVAPALTLYFWGFAEARGVGWIAVLIYAICCVLRLARFNVDKRGEPAERKESPHFTGVPSPAGALLAMLPLYVSKLIPGTVSQAEVATGLWLVIVGLLMIARMKTPSLKAVKVYADTVKFVVVGFVVLVAALLTYPWVTLTVLSLAYLVMLAWGYRRRNGPVEED